MEPPLAAQAIQDLLHADDLFHRLGGIASWTESATYLVQPACPRVAEANQARLIDLDPETPPESFLRDTGEVFREHGIQDYQVHLDERSRPAGLGRFLARQGLEERRDRLWLMERAPALPRLPVHVLETSEEAVRQDFEGLLDRWGMASLDGEVCIQLADLRRFRRESGMVREYVAYWEGEAAAAATVVQVGGLILLKDLHVDRKYTDRGVERGLLAMVATVRFEQGASLAGVCGEVAGFEGPTLEVLGFQPAGEAATFTGRL